MVFISYSKVTKLMKREVDKAEFVCQNYGGCYMKKDAQAKA